MLTRKLHDQREDRPMDAEEPEARAEAAVRHLLRHKTRRAELHGAHGSYLALLLARLTSGHELGGPLFVVTADDESARSLAGDLGFFLGRRDDAAMELPEASVLAVPETSPYAEVAADRSALLERLAGLYRLTSSPPLRPKAVVCAAASLRRKVLPRGVFAALCEQVSVDQDLERDGLVSRLIASGYDRCDVVDDPGTFAVRGGIVDVFPPLHRFPARIELFADVVESMRLFDPQSQRTLRRIDHVRLHPVREIVRGTGVEPKERLRRLADALHHPTRSLRAVVDEVDSGRNFLGIEAFTPAFVSALEPLWTYLADDTPWVVVHPDAVRLALEQQDERSAEAHAARIQDGRLAFPPDELFSDAAQVAERLQRGPLLEVHATETVEARHAVVTAARDNAQLSAQLKRARSERGEEILKALAEHLRQWTDEEGAAVVAAGTAAHVDKVEALLGAHGLAATVHHEPGTPFLLADQPLAGVHIQTGDLGRGFCTLDRLLVLSHEEIFGPKTTRRPQRRAIGAGLGDLHDLSPGDHVVHTDHGVGCYRGLIKLEVGDVPADFLLLEYAGGDRLYLPVHRMNQVQKYVGADGAAAKLDKLGGTTWQRKKRKVQADVRRFGEELLQLYAQRAALAGHAHDPPGPEYTEFEETFPFSETDDQLHAISDTIGDLTTARPMDRLVCGDVGFGKTEVALRAAFLVAMSGRQVALLAPTTVLVAQHQRTFSERLAPYPLRVEAISRFRKPAELRSALADVAAGRVDIIIGTHRLLSTDVQFKDLALLVIDEEQRFGVKHKERMKRLRTQVDVLALTATPIPRTLQLSMVGLREISVIATPPADRMAIRTLVCRQDDALIAEAIRKELDRGGQVFFVHNEVRTIDKWAARVTKLVPRARVAVGHGQMDARRLERVMLDFVAGRSDVLVCTTIVESGLDIPRVNTMFVNNAHAFGLSQLYQLRGRIGRSHLRAYCYLMVPGIERMSGEARQRLDILQQFTQLGSGFSIASYDLELRGAGDLLGARQSGHIAAVGFEAYARILEEAVAELKGEPIIRDSDPDLNVQVAAFIPDDYVEETGQRLELYKRLSDACRQQPDLSDIIAEMRDRYGPVPEEVEALGDLMAIKGMAITLRAKAVDITTTRLLLTLGDDTHLPAQVVTALATDSHLGFRLQPGQRLSRALLDHEQRHPLHAARKALQAICP